MEVTINRVMELLALDKPSDSDLTAQLRRRQRKIGQEEKVAAVMMTATLLVRYDNDQGADKTPPAQSVPIPLALPIAPISARPKAEGQKSVASISERDIIHKLVTDVVNAVSVPFLLRMMQTFAKKSDSRKTQAFPIHRSALMLLWELSSNPAAADSIVDMLDPSMDTLFSIAFSSNAVVPRESVERILIIFKNLCVNYVRQMHTKKSTPGRTDHIHRCITQNVAKLLNRSIKNSTPYPTSVLKYVVEIFNYFHTSYYRFLSTIGTHDNSETVLEEDMSAHAKVQLAITVSHQTSFCLRQLIIQGLHGYASDHIRDTTLMACYFLLKESIDLMRPFEIDSNTHPVVKCQSLVPIMWCVEPDDGMNMQLECLAEDEANSQSTDPKQCRKAEKETRKVNKSEAHSAPIGQFPLLLCSIVRIELRLLFQQALASFNDMRELSIETDEFDEDKSPAKSAAASTVEEEDRIQRMMYLLLSIFDQILILLVGDHNRAPDDNDEDDDDDDDKDSTAVWAGLPHPVLTRIRQYIHFIIHDMFEFINEAAMMIQSQHRHVKTAGEISSQSVSHKGLTKLVNACSRVGRSLSFWLTEDEDLLNPFLHGLNGISEKSSSNPNVFVDSILSCSRIYHAVIDREKGRNEGDGDGDLVHDYKHASKPVKEQEIVFDIESTLNLAQIFCGGSLFSEDSESREGEELNEEEERLMLPFSRFGDNYNRTNMDINFALDQGDILQFLLPVFLSITQSESQSFQEGEEESIVLLPQLTRPECEFTEKLLKLCLVSLFISQSTYAGASGTISRLYTTGSMACDQLSILLEHFMTEQSGNLDSSRVLGVAVVRWTAFFGSVKKALTAQNRSKSSEMSTIKTHAAFMSSLKLLKNTLDLLSSTTNLM